DGPHELLERARGRGQARDVGEERQLLESALLVRDAGWGGQAGLGHVSMVRCIGGTCNGARRVGARAERSAGGRDHPMVIATAEPWRAGYGRARDGASAVIAPTIGCDRPVRAL